jgi:uncharacterized protein (TIGR03086 family)
MSEVRDRYVRIADGFGARLDGVGTQQWGDPTPCTEWDVGALVGHVIDAHGQVMASIGADSTGDSSGDAPVADAPARWQAATERVRAWLDDPERAGATVSGGPFGEQSFESLVGRLLCTDTLFHTWDLARATGQDEHLDPVGVTRAMEFLEPMDEAIRRPGAFGPKIDPSPGADDQTRLLNFGGRAG